jgi:hypothetical protein
MTRHRPMSVAAGLTLLAIMTVVPAAIRTAEK